MDTTTLDSNTITLMVTIAGSWLTLVGLIFFQFSRLDTKINALDTKFDTKIDALGRDVTDVRERLARVEGHLMGPGSLAPGPSPAPADGLDDDHRRAG
ncbi:MAG: hypothetical protein F4017_04695 [Acidimicrobiaceae bacterium]|nr:hypothetical protein [Acidimicrobiaceae bacterium]